LRARAIIHPAVLVFWNFLDIHQKNMSKIHELLVSCEHVSICHRILKSVNHGY
jgi:hypothetical protein